MNKINGNITKQPNRFRMCKILQTTCFLQLMSDMKKKGRTTARLKDTRDLSTKFSVWALLGPTLNKM